MFGSTVVHMRSDTRGLLAAWQVVGLRSESIAWTWQPTHRKTAQSDKEIQTVTGNILIKISRLKSMVGVISLVISGLVTCKLEGSMGLK